MWTLRHEERREEKAGAIDDREKKGVLNSEGIGRSDIAGPNKDAHRNAYGQSGEISAIARQSKTHRMPGRSRSIGEESIIYQPTNRHRSM